MVRSNSHSRFLPTYCTLTHYEIACTDQRWVATYLKQCHRVAGVRIVCCDHSWKCCNMSGLNPRSSLSVGNAVFSNTSPLTFIAGPCQIESASHALECAIALAEIARRLSVGLVFKSSFDKANRTSASAGRGVGLNSALQIFSDIRSSTGLPILTDVHERDQCAIVACAQELHSYRILTLARI